MMCDSVEAATKSLDKPDNDKIDSFVETIIDKQVEDQQFENCELTFKNISIIKSVLKEKLKNDFSKFINKNIRPLAEFEEGRRALIMANAAKKSLGSKKFEKLTF